MRSVRTGCFSRTQPPTLGSPGGVGVDIEGQAWDPLRMQTIVTTTVTTVIDLETFEPTHSVDIAAENVLPNELVLAAALGGTEAAAATLREQVRPKSDPQECEDDESPVDNRQDRRNPPAEPTPENPSETGV